VLQLVTAEYLFKLRPGSKEGEMTQIRSAMVNTNTLAALAEELGLGSYLYLGKGIARGGGRSLKSLLANAFEAVLGAIFLDAGYDAAYHYYLDRFRALPEPVQDENHKGRLQQVVQEKFGQTPYYDSVSARGGRQREYTAVVYAGAEPLGTGHGTTKQGAEQDAARNALAELSRRDAAGRSARRPRRRDDQLAEQPAQPDQPASAELDGGAYGAPDTPQAGEQPQEQAPGLPQAPVAAPEVTAASESPRPRRRRRKAAAPASEQVEAEPAAEQPPAPPAPPTTPARRSRRRRPQPGASSEAEASQAATGLPSGDAGQP
jgi:dsRNA-specific ribonuclease